MPKDQRVNSLSINQARASPYPWRLRDTGLKSEKSFPFVGDEREWEESRCAICMEHPHNAVLLLCSSIEKGCRPYMCDTSYRHSNCLDQFCKSSTANSNLPVANAASGSSSHRGRMERSIYGHVRSLGNQPLVCPLCRGHIKGCVVVEAARSFMNSKRRSCSLETCGFAGTYIELRKHARREHPSYHPSDTDPRRECEWSRLQLQREFGDTLSAYLSHFGDDDSESDDGGLFNVFDGVYSDAVEDEWNDDNDSAMDLEHELASSLLTELHFDVCAFDDWDDLGDFEDETIQPLETISRSSTVSSNYYTEDRPRNSTLHPIHVSATRPLQSRPRRSAVSSNYYREVNIRYRGSTRPSNAQNDNGGFAYRRNTRRIDRSSRYQRWVYDP